MLFIGLLFTVGGISAARPVLRILNTPMDFLPGASAYLITMVSGTLIVMGYNLTSALLRGLGDGKSPLAAMIIAALLNIGYTNRIQADEFLINYYNKLQPEGECAMELFDRFNADIH